MKFLEKIYTQHTLNGKTPKWFKDWHSKEFLPLKIRQDIFIILSTGIFIALVADLIAAIV